KMRGRANPSVPVHHLFPVRLHMRDEIIEVPSRKILSGDEDHRRFRDHPDRLEVLDRVAAEVAVEGGIGRMAKGHPEQRAAIRRGWSDLCRAERAARSRLRNDLLSSYSGDAGYPPLGGLLDCPPVGGIAHKKGKPRPQASGARRVAYLRSRVRT